MSVRFALRILVAALLAGPCAARALPPRTPDEIRWGNNMAMAPKISCNTHFSAAGVKDTFGWQCHLLQKLCAYGSTPACHRVAAYTPDFHNILHEGRIGSFMTMGGYEAMHQPKPLLPAQGRHRPGWIDPSLAASASLKPKVLGGYVAP